MGAWGYYDDENDSAHDSFCGFFEEKLEPIQFSDPKTIFDALYEYVIERTDEESEAVGVFILTCKHIQKGKLTGTFGDRLTDIGQAAVNKAAGSQPKPSPLDKLAFDDPRVINQKLVKMMIQYVKVLQKYDHEGWCDPKDREDALKDEYRFLKSMLVHDQA